MKKKHEVRRAKLVMTKRKRIFIFSRISILKEHSLYSMNIILIRRSGKLIDKIVYYNCNYLSKCEESVFSDLFFNVVNDYINRNETCIEPCIFCI